MKDFLSKGKQLKEFMLQFLHLINKAMNINE